MVNFFEHAYKTKDSNGIDNQIWTSNSYPTMFDSTKNEDLYKAVDLEEVHTVLKSFTKDKFPGPDGWTIALFLFFFDLMGLDLVRMVEESRVGGHITVVINSTYIVLIPK